MSFPMKTACRQSLQRKSEGFPRTQLEPRLTTAKPPEKRCEMKPYTTIQLNVKVTEDTADQIRKLAITHDITVAEQLRRFIEQGLSVQCYEQNIDLIASIIRQELMSIYHPEDIQRRVAEQLEESLRKFEIAQRKSGKVSASGYFLLIKMMMYLTNQISVEDFVHMVEESGKLGVEYMKLSLIHI